MTSSTPRIALVTGASRGIGAAIAQELAQAGCLVIGTATSDKGRDGINQALAAFPGCRLGILHVDHARLRDVDLRGAEMSRIDDATALAGAVVSPTQLLDLAPLLAAALGIRVQADD